MKSIPRSCHFGFRCALLGAVLLAAATVLRAAEARAVKWHPGHYAYVGGGQLTAEVLALPYFRGAQKNYSWRTFEPEEGRTGFSSLRADHSLVRKHDRQSTPCLLPPSRPSQTCLPPTVLHALRSFPV